MVSLPPFGLGGFSRWSILNEARSVPHRRRAASHRRNLTGYLEKWQIDSRNDDRDVTVHGCQTGSCETCHRHRAGVRLLRLRRLRRLLEPPELRVAQLEAGVGVEGDASL